jgi:hypothetical protein
MITELKSTSVIAKTITVADKQSIEDVLPTMLQKSFYEYRTVSVQVDWRGLTGTLDGVVQLTQSNSSTFIDISGKLANLGTENGTKIIELIDFSTAKLGITFDVGGITGGDLTVVVVAKR